MKRMVAGAALLVLLGAACGSNTPELAGFVRTPLPVVGTASLPDAGAGGASFTMQANAGEILVVYFGYTACPDVCPTTLADVRSALADLGDDAGRVTVAVATVDPGRDTADVIASYVQAFVADGHGLRTEDDEQLRAVADAFGASYEVSIGADGTVEVAHTAHLYAVDDAGRLRVTWAFGTEPGDIAADLRILLDSA